MTLQCETGTFNKVSSAVADTQDVTTGFIPKAIILWAEYNKTSDGVSGFDAYFSYGFSDGTNHMSMATAGEDIQSSSDTARGSDNAKVLNFHNEAGSSIQSCTVSFSATKFTLDWGVGNNTYTTIIHYIIYGGDDITGVEVGVIDSKTTTGTQSYTMSSADVKDITDDQGVVFFGTHTGSSIPTSTVSHFHSIGAASSASNEAAIFEDDVDAASTTDIDQEISSDSCILVNYTGSPFIQANFLGWDSDGFNLNWSTASSTARKVIYMVIKGGQWEVGTDTAKATTGTEVTTTAFQPVGLFNVATLLTTADANQTGTDISLIFGGADGTNEAAGGVMSEDGNTSSVTAIMSSSTKCLAVYDDTTAKAEADLDSFNSTDFTLDYTTANGAYYFMWVVCGSSVGAAGFAYSQGCVIG